MRVFRTLLLFSAVAATVGLSAEGIGAQAPQFRSEVLVRGQAQAGAAGDHFLTFSGPVAVPGASLASGTYLFRRLSPGLLQVMSPNREHVYAVVFAVPAMRPRATDTYEVQLAVTDRPSSPHRIIAWFRPGEASGQELIYPSRSRQRGDGN